MLRVKVMTRVPLLLSVFLAIPGLVMAQGAPATPPPAQTQPLPQAQLSPQAQLKTSSTRWGAGVHVQKESIDFFSCADRCARSPASLSVPLPLEAQGKKSRVKVLQLKDGVSAFLIEVGDAEARHYSVLVLGADRGPIVEGAGSEQPLPAPALVLKGWTEPGQQQLSVQESTSGVRVLLISGVTQAVCGRTLPEQTKMLDPKSGQFRVSRLPVLAAEERKNARPLPLSLLSWSENDVALRLQAKAGKEAVAVDGDRQLPWDRSISKPVR